MAIAVLDGCREQLKPRYSRKWQNAKLKKITFTAFGPLTNCVDNIGYLVQRRKWNIKLVGKLVEQKRKKFEQD